MLIAVIGTMVLGNPSAASAQPNPPAPPGKTPSTVQDRGASTPFTEIEAEGADTNGSVLDPDRTYTTLSAEASGRQAVRLSAPGQYVEFTLTEPANAMTLRYSVPDNAEGTGITAPADVQVNGTKRAEMPLTSKYGWFYGEFPFTNTPGENPHHFYDEARTMFGETLPAGSKVRIQVPENAGAEWFALDLADFENVPAPVEQPADSLSVADFGADSTGAQDSTTAFQEAVNAGAAQGKEVWIPQGTFRLTDHVIVDGVTLRGAGPWYSVLTGRHPTDPGKAAGIFGKHAEDGGPSRDVHLRDFAIMGELTERVDSAPVNAIGGAMSNSTVDNLWLQHTKVGAWMDGPMDEFIISNSRILDQTADGVNFHRGVTNSAVRNTFVRNTGDDGLAMWAEGQNNVGNTFEGNTVVLPILANNIAIYGGKDISVTGNVVADSVLNGGGLHVANRYPGVGPDSGTDVSGTFTLARNTAIRTGSTDDGWPFPIAAVWFDARNSPIDKAAINVTDTDVVDSSHAAAQFVSGRVDGAHFERVRIDGTRTFALQLHDPGSASFADVTANGIGHADNTVYSCIGEQFAINEEGGNSGWNEKLPATYCGEFPK